MMVHMNALLSQASVLLLIRIALGVVMIYYGWPKIRNLRKNASDFVGMGFSPGWFFGTIVAAVEFFGGALLVLGIIPELAAAAFGFQMLLGMFWKMKIGKGFPDWSYDVLALSVALVIMAFGGGTFAGSFEGSWLLRWDVVFGAIILAFVGARASKPAIK